jgi:hypothetical protein
VTKRVQPTRIEPVTCSLQGSPGSLRRDRLEDHGAGFHSASMAGLGVVCNRLETALRSQAQLRTRTGDPFLTMEVLYQLS